jgi:hypothetical protein
MAIGMNTAWTDGEVTIPAAGTTERKDYDRRYYAAVEERFGGSRVTLERITVGIGDLVLTNLVVNQARYKLYSQMLSAGDAVPVLVVEKVGGGKLRVIDGNHRAAAALEAGIQEMEAIALERH